MMGEGELNGFEASKSQDWTGGKLLETLWSLLILVTMANQPKDEGHLQQTPEGDI